MSSPSPTTSNPHPVGAFIVTLGVLRCSAGLEHHWEKCNSDLMKTEVIQTSAGEKGKRGHPGNRWGWSTAWVILSKWGKLYWRYAVANGRWNRALFQIHVDAVRHTHLWETGRMPASVPRCNTFFVCFHCSSVCLLGEAVTCNSSTPTSHQLLSYQN